MGDVRELTLDELVEGGVLQQVNRLLLHPAGLALSRQVNFHGVQDGLTVYEVAPNRTGQGWTAVKAEAFQARLDANLPARVRSLGYQVQPIEGYDDSRPARLSADDQTIEACLDALEGFLENTAVRDAVTPEDLIEPALRDLLGPFLARLRIHPAGVLKAGPQGVNEDDPLRPELTPQQQARARWLARDLPLLARGLNEDGERDLQRSDDSLSGTELGEADGLAEAVLSWHPADPPPEAAKQLARMEELYGLAQPGMAFLRGKPDARGRVDKQAARLQAAHDEWAAKRGELEAFLSGDLAASALRDPEAVKRAVEDRLAPHAAELEALDQERTRVLAALAPLQAALGRLT